MFFRCFRNPCKHCLIAALLLGQLVLTRHGLAEPGYSEPTAVAYGEAIQAPVGSTIRLPDFELFMPANWSSASQKLKGSQKRQKIFRISFAVRKPTVWVSKVPAVPLRDRGEWFEWEVPSAGDPDPVFFSFQGKCFSITQTAPADPATGHEPQLPLGTIRVDETSDTNCEAIAHPRKR